MPRLSFRTKLLVSYVALVAFVVLLATVELHRSLGEDLVSQLDARLAAQADAAAQWIGGGRHPNRLAGRLASVVGAEITLVDRDGAVIGYAKSTALPPRDPSGADLPDSRAPDMPLQNAEPEVRAARDSGRGFATRASPSGAPMRYAAVSTTGGLVLRLGAPLSGIDATLADMRSRLLVAAALAMAAAVLLGVAASRLVARPLRQMADAARKIADGDYKARADSSSPDELGALATALASMAAQLEARIGDLTAERDRLSALLAQVRRLEVVRRDFVANLSHELRTPVTAIQGYSETLLATPPDPDTRSRFLATIHRHAERLGHLLEDLVQLSALEAAPPESAVREPVPVRAVARLVAQTVEERRRAKSATLAVDIPEDAIAVADPVGLEQVLENLVDNALKHGPTGVSVRLSTSREGSSLHIDVRDTGPGIAPEHLPRIFERFYRVDPARSREHGGAGLGLAIVKHLVEAMSGAVTADSEVGKGSVFRITLPAAPP